MNNLPVKEQCAERQSFGQRNVDALGDDPNPADAVAGPDIKESNEERTNIRNKVIAAVVMTVMDYYSSDSDDDEDETLLQLKMQNKYLMDYALVLCNKNSRNSVKHYVEEIVPSYTEKEFRMHYRISRSLFESLCQKMLISEEYKNLRPDRRLPEKTYLLVFLWFAGHEACSFRDLSDRFDLSISTISTIIKIVTMFISNLSPSVIKWPNDQQKEESSQVFNNKCMFSKAIGCIDGTHIEIDPPKRGKDDYIDRKGRVSVVLQGICNEQKKFINIFCGYPGSSHDSWVFKNSSIYDKLNSYCGDYYLLGDSAYPCSKNVITPYRDNGHLTRAQKTFNVKLSSGRVAIEHTYGMLKQRFRQMFYCKLKGMKKICHFIRSCCVLHNLADEDDLNFEESAAESSNEMPTNNAASRRNEQNSVRNLICQDIQHRMSQNI